MDDAVIRAMARWPNVPAVWGWLSLDRRGAWRIKGGTIPNRAAVAFIARNYASDRQGRWFFQNGPQRVFVDLAYTPWIYSLDGRGALVTHTGRDCGAVKGAWIDETGTMILLGEPGPGIVDDRDLLALSDRLAGEHGQPAEDDLVAAFVASRPGAEPGLRLSHAGAHVPVRRIDSVDVPERLCFDPHPVENATGAGTPRAPPMSIAGGSPLSSPASANPARTSRSQP